MDRPEGREIVEVGRTGHDGLCKEGATGMSVWCLQGFPSSLGFNTLKKQEERDLLGSLPSSPYISLSTLGTTGRREMFPECPAPILLPQVG